MFIEKSIIGRFKSRIGWRSFYDADVKGSFSDGHRSKFFADSYAVYQAPAYACASLAALIESANSFLTSWNEP